MRGTTRLKINPMTNLLAWMAAAAVALATIYGVVGYNILEEYHVALPCPACPAECPGPCPPCLQAPQLNRVLYNGFAKISWAVCVSWVVLACAKRRGGIVNSILSWNVWVPLARVQYCVYLLHRTIIYIINSWTEETIRYTHTLLAIQFIAILTISTFAAFVFVILFEAPIVQMEKLFFGSLGLGKMPQKRKD